MPWMDGGITVLVVVALALLAMVALRPSLTRERGGKILAFLALFVLPLAITALGASAHLEGSKSTGFCLSCHVMEPYGRSLWIDDGEYLPAAHFQNNRVPKEHACYSCHTQYTMYGDLAAKWKGLRHLWVNYLGTVPEEIELYEPYRNRECLHCHGSARSFLEGGIHADMMAELIADETSCLECHDLTHSVDSLAEMEMWQREAP